MLNKSNIYIFLVLLFLNSSNVFSQSCQYSIYYKYCKNAEKEIIIENYKEAIISYKLAFNSIGKNIPFPVDLYNLTLCYASIKNYRKSVNELRKLCKLGFNLDLLLGDNIEKKNILNTLVKTHHFKSLHIRYKKNKVPLYKSIDTATRRKFFEMKFLDQYYRLRTNGYSLFRDSIIKVDSINAEELKLIFETHKKFPSHMEIGVDTTWAFTNPLYFLIIFHHTEGMFGRTTDFSELIIKSFQQNSFSGGVASKLLQSANHLNDFGNNIFSINAWDTTSSGYYTVTEDEINLPKCIGFMDDLDSNKIIHINANRKMLCLDGILDVMQKLRITYTKHNLQNLLFILNLPDLNINLWKQKKDYENACKKTREIISNSF